MKIRTLVTVLSIATLATAAQAQWIATQPGTITAAPGTLASGTFELTGSSSYTTGTYDVGTPVVEWYGTPPPSPDVTVSQSTVDIFTYLTYGNFVVNETPVLVTINFTVPANATAGTTYQGTVYEPLTGDGATQQTLLGTFVVKVN